MEQLLVTGANGFVGRVLCELASARGYGGAAAARVGSRVSSAIKLRRLVIGDINGETDWNVALEGVSTVIHTAGRAHVMREHAQDPLLEFRRVNTEGTRRLAECAVRNGARRIVFVSSVKVNGESTRHSAAFRENDAPSPRDPYGVSKAEGEQALLDIGERTGLEVVIVRPPLVYGSGVRANFLKLMQWIDRGLPLPFGAVHNRRSMVSVWNLADLLLTCAFHPNAPGHVFFASDERVVSTAELVTLLASALGRPARLIPVPPKALKLLGAALGRSAEIARLCDSLCVDHTHAWTRLTWRPIVSLEEGIWRTANWYRSRASIPDATQT